MSPGLGFERLGFRTPQMYSSTYLLLFSYISYLRSALSAYCMIMIYSPATNFITSHLNVQNGIVIEHILLLLNYIEWNERWSNRFEIVTSDGHQRRRAEKYTGEPSGLKFQLLRAREKNYEKNSNLFEGIFTLNCNNLKLSIKRGWWPFFLGWYIPCHTSSDRKSVV